MNHWLDQGVMNAKLIEQRVEDLKLEVAMLKDGEQLLLGEVEARDKRIAELEEALGFYSDESNYNLMSLILRKRREDEYTPVENDRGIKARAALRAVKGEEPSLDH